MFCGIICKCLLTYWTLNVVVEELDLSEGIALKKQVKIRFWVLPSHIWELTTLFLARHCNPLIFRFSIWYYVCYLLSWIFFSDLLSAIRCLVFFPIWNLLTILYSGFFSGVWTSLSKAVINEMIHYCYSRMLSSHNCYVLYDSKFWIKMRNYSYLASYLGISKKLYLFVQSTIKSGCKSTTLRLLT